MQRQVFLLFLYSTSVSILTTTCSGISSYSYCTYLPYFMQIATTLLVVVAVGMMVKIRPSAVLGRYFESLNSKFRRNKKNSKSTKNWNLWLRCDVPADLALRTIIQNTRGCNLPIWRTNFSLFLRAALYSACFVLFAKKVPELSTAIIQTRIVLLSRRIRTGFLHHRNLLQYLQLFLPSHPGAPTRCRRQIRSSIFALPSSTSYPGSLTCHDEKIIVSSTIAMSFLSSRPRFGSDTKLRRDANEVRTKAAYRYEEAQDGA